MPTGYTHGVQDGTVTEFKDFALKCARAMGANVMMRDEPSDAPIKVYEPSGYYQERLDEDQEELKKIKAMSDQECEDAAEEQFFNECERQEERIITKIENKARYTKMLNSVSQWKEPTIEHKGLKQFMFNQLTESIKWDCDTSDLNTPKRITGEEWRQDKLEYLYQSIPRTEQSRLEEIEGAEESNEWNRQLIKSLSLHQHTKSK